MKRPIALSLAPNNTADDITVAFKSLLRFWAYTNGESIRNLELWFRNFFNSSYAISFISGRAALYSILHTLSIGKGDEVILQAFTCSVVPHAILENFASPIYVDTNDHFTMDTIDLEKKITKNTKAIIIQHTFGIPAEMDEIMSIAKKNNIDVIEDCAHILGGTYKGKLLGTFGKAAIFSFGRDKAFSSVFGGMALTNEKEFGQNLRIFQKKLIFPSFTWTLQQLFHPIAFSVILPLYHFFAIGKILLVVLQKLNFLSFPVNEYEKIAKRNSMKIKKLPNALAFLALHQLRKIKEYNQKRIEFGKLYQNHFMQLIQGDAIPFLRYPLLLENKNEFLTSLRKNKILLGTWYSNVIDPKGVDINAFGYESGSCPNAEKLSKQVVNLPTYPVLTKKELEKVIELSKKYGNY